MKFYTPLKFSLFILLLVFASSCNTSKILYFERIKPSTTPHQYSVANIAIGNNLAIAPEDKVLNQLSITPLDIQAATVNALASFEIFKQITVIDTKRFEQFESNTAIPENELESIFKHIDSHSLFYITDLTAIETNRMTVSDAELYSFSIKGILAQKSPNLKHVVVDFNEHITMPPLKTMGAYDKREFHKYVVQELGYRIATQIAPHWQQLERYLYIKKELKAGNKLFNTNKIDEARKEWAKAFDNTIDPETKAKAALNITYTYEVADDIENGIQWAEKALENSAIFEKIKRNKEGLLLVDESKELTFYSYIYIVTLQKRQEEIASLNKQLNNDL